MIDRDHGVYVFPDTNAHFLGEKRRSTFIPSASPRASCGASEASPRDSVYIDLWDDYLEPA